MLDWRWLRASAWLFIWRWCLRTIWNIFIVLTVRTRNTTTKMTNGMKNHSAVIQNLSTTHNITDKIQITRVACKIRETVTNALYRKCRCKAISRSTDTAATEKNETPAVVQADLTWSILNQQYTVKFLSISAILNPTKSGWHMRPTRRSEKAMQPKRTKDGEWRPRFFLIARRIVELPTNVMIPNYTLRMQVKTFATKSSCALSKLIPVK